MRSADARLSLSYLSRNIKAQIRQPQLGPIAPKADAQHRVRDNDIRITTGTFIERPPAPKRHPDVVSEIAQLLRQCLAGIEPIESVCQRDRRHQTSPLVAHLEQREIFTCRLDAEQLGYPGVKFSRDMAHHQAAHDAIVQE